MTNPYPAPRRLERSRKDKILGGVCGGVAHYLNMDPTLVRVLTVLITLFTGVPIVLYIVALFVMPEEPATPTVPPSVGPAAQGFPPYPTGDPVWGAAGAPWEQPAPAPAPQTSPSSEPGQSTPPRAEDTGETKPS